MYWELHFCPNHGCTIDGWIAWRSPGNDALWHLAGRSGGVFTVAAVSPVCPRCGTTLCPAVEQAQNAAGSALVEEPALEFAHGLRYSFEHSR